MVKIPFAVVQYAKIELVGSMCMMWTMFFASPFCDIEARIFVFLDVDLDI